MIFHTLEDFLETSLSGNGAFFVLGTDWYCPTNQCPTPWGRTWLGLILDKVRPSTLLLHPSSCYDKNWYLGVIDRWCPLLWGNYFNKYARCLVSSLTATGTGTTLDQNTLSLWLLRMPPSIDAWSLPCWVSLKSFESWLFWRISKVLVTWLDWIILQHRMHSTILFRINDEHCLRMLITSPIPW